MTSFMYRRPISIAAALSLCSVALAAQRAGSADEKTAMLQAIDARRSTYADVAKQIWGFAEVGYQEEKSSALLEQQLKAAGFSVTARAADTPTAFVASYGSGKPVIAVLGEFDALPGLSQAALPDRSPVTAGAPGHGCGHNLLGSGAALAVVTLKQYMEANH